MGLNEGLLRELELEAANTRKVLERVPLEKKDWKPHIRSTSLGALATHLAYLPHWTVATLEGDALDPATVPAPTMATSTEELLRSFDAHVRDAKEALARADDTRLLGSWSLLMQGKPVFTLPRIVVLRNFVINHTIHHRAQLGVYLRLNDVPVPSIYGPTADEGIP